MSIFSVGAIGLDLQINGRNLRKQIKAESKAASSSMESAFSSSFKKIGAMAAAAFSVQAVGKFVGSCLELGSNLSEVQNVVDTAFPKMSAQVDAFAKNAMESFGLSETVAKQYMGTFGAMSKAFGFAEQDAYEMSATLTGLAGDVASFYNLDPSEAYTKLKSVFTGETESLKDLGVVMTQAALDQYALANGFGKTTSAMSEQEKVSLRLAFVTDQLSLASGDFIRTQDSWANQTRVLALRFDALKASLGKGFIAVFTPIVKGINWVLANLQPLADSFASLMEMLTGSSGDTGGGSGAALADTSADLSSATDAADSLGSGLSDTGKKGESAAKKIKKAFAGVDTINKLSFDSGSSGSDSGSGGSGGGSAGGGNVAEAVDFPKAAKEANAFNGMLQGIIDEFKRLGELFKQGFEIGFGDSFENLDRLKWYAVTIKNSLKSIFTDPEVAGAAKKWVDSTVMALGQITGSIASIGTTIATLLVGSVATYLSSNTEFIKSIIKKWFLIDSEINEIVGDFSSALADIASVFSSPTAINIGANLITAIVNGALGAMVVIKQLGLDILDTLTGPIIENKDKIKQALEETLKPIETITETLANAVNDTLKSIFDAYEEHVKPAFDNIKQGLSDIVGTLLDSYNTYIAPVLNEISGRFQEMWEEHIQPAIDGIITFIGKITELVSLVFKNIFAPFIEFLTENLAPVVGEVLGGIWDIIEELVSFIGDCANTIIDILNSICDFLLDVFSGDWEKVWNDICSFLQNIWDSMCQFVDDAINSIKSVIDDVLGAIEDTWNNVWEGVSNFVGDIWNGICSTIDSAINGVQDAISGVLDKISSIWEDMWSGLKDFVKSTWDKIIDLFGEGGKIFSGVVGGIANVFKNIVNCILDGINKVIRVPFGTINGLLNTIRTIDIPIIGQPFLGLWGKNPLPVPQIPKLAEGGYVGANQPQLAMIGDNKRYGEIVAPENKMLDMINTALQMQRDQGSASGIRQIISLLKQLITLIANLNLSVDIDRKKLAILLRQAEKELEMIGG
jgi:phage-related protein